MKNEECEEKLQIRNIEICEDDDDIELMRKMTWNEPEDEMNMTMNEYEHEHENDSKVKTNEDEHEVNDEEAKLMETAKWTNDGNESDEHERKNDKNKCEEWDNEVGRMTMITKMSEMKRHEKVKTDEHEHWMITEARKRCRDRKKTNRYTLLCRQFN